jgi:ribokinase
VAGSREDGRASICVVGAALIDLISYVPRLPRIGETLHGSDFRMGYGGKGANQAVMAAKLGARVSIVTGLGRDVFGDGTLENFASFNVDTTYIAVHDEAPSGVAPIAVGPGGDNAIIIITGANDRISRGDVERARSAIAAAGVQPPSYTTSRTSCARTRSRPSSCSVTSSSPAARRRRSCSRAAHAR